MYFRLLAMGLIPVAVTIVFYLLKRKTKFGIIKHDKRQIIIGVVFGLLAMAATDYGVDIGGAVANIRDAAPLCAGLFFGGPSGIIAGVMGGVYRSLAAYNGVGVYSQVACSVSTTMAGVFAAFLRKYIFEDLRPTWSFAIVVGIITEVFHMTILLLTHMDDLEQAYRIMKICTMPMIFANSFSVFLAALSLQILSHTINQEEERKQRITQKVQRKMLFIVILAFLGTTVFMYGLQTTSCIRLATSQIKLNLDDVKTDVEDTSDENLLALNRAIVEELKIDVNASLITLSEEYCVPEISIIDHTNIITKSTNPEYVGFNMSLGEQSNEFSCLLNGTEEYVQNFRNISYDSDNDAMAMKYAGVVYQDGYVQIGYNSEAFQKQLKKEVASVTANRRVGETGYIIIADSEGLIVSDRSDHRENDLANAGLDQYSQYDAGTIFEAAVHGEKCYCMMEQAEGYYLFGIIPEEEVMANREVSNYVNSFMEVLIFAILFVFVCLILQRNVSREVHEINKGLNSIIHGNLDTVIDVQSTTEFASLSNGINSTVATLKQYIEEAENRMNEDLKLAKSIQSSALPSVFPRDKRYRLFATMHTAKEVGGDFYDYFPLGDDKAAFVMADVSGKGVPAAMFMMRAKTIIKSFAENGLSIQEICTLANERLCEGNDAEMFVTAWVGIMDLNSGTITYSNCGHNPPLVYRLAGSYEYLKSKVDLVMACMEGFRYRAQELKLNPGDKLYLYTDGVTEACNPEGGFYGEERLRTMLNDNKTASPEKTLDMVYRDLDTFMNGGDQFDDITMMEIEYIGGGE